MKWKDTSSYSRGATNRDVQTVTAGAGGLKIVVTRHIHHPGKWLLRCSPFFNERELQAVDLQKAKKEAVGLVRHEVMIIESALKSGDDDCEHFWIKDRSSDYHYKWCKKCGRETTDMLEK